LLVALAVGFAVSEIRGTGKWELKHDDDKLSRRKEEIEKESTQANVIAYRPVLPIRPV